jgi:hypothetical protein
MTKYFSAPKAASGKLRARKPDQELTSRKADVRSSRRERRLRARGLVLTSGAVALSTLFVLAILAVPVSASSNCTPQNCNVHDGTFDLGPLGTNPCTGVAFASDLIVTGNLHYSSSSDSSHFTATVEGSFTISQSNGVTYTGHTVAWFDGNIAPDGHAEFSNNNNFHGVGTDGSTLDIHANTHMTILADGTITSNVSDVTCH